RGRQVTVDGLRYLRGRFGRDEERPAPDVELALEGIRDARALTVFAGPAPFEDAGAPGVGPETHLRQTHPLAHQIVDAALTAHVGDEPIVDQAHVDRMITDIEAHVPAPLECHSA